MRFYSRSFRWLLPVLLIIATVIPAVTQNTEAASSASTARLLKSVPPVYPPLARKAGIDGDVVLDVVIGADGAVQSATVLRGDPFLTQAAADAVKQWKYKPSEVEVRTQVTVSFSSKNAAGTEGAVSPSGAPSVNAEPGIGVSFQAPKSRTSTALTKLVIDSVIQSGPADKAGLRPGDTIISLDGKLLSTFDEFSALIGTRKVGSTIRIGYLRSTQQSETVATLVDRDLLFREWSKKRAAQGDADGQYAVATMYYRGNGMPQDYRLAYEWYSKAAEQGLVGAQAAVGNMLMTGQGVQQNYQQAASWLSKAAEQGEPTAQCWLGNLYAEGNGVPRDPKRAIELWTKAAESGNASAQDNLGIVYGVGEVVTKDYKQAVQWYTKAAEQGHARAQSHLASMYYVGQGVVQDYGQAIRWFTKSAEQGYPRAQFMLGYSYATGIGISKDDSQADEWLRKAAEQGNADAKAYIAHKGNTAAMLELAHSYENGTGVTENYDEALKWLRWSADSGNVDAMLEFGLFCETGNHMAKDKNAALTWYRKAIEHGSKAAVSSAMGVNGAKNREVKTVEHCPDGASTNFSEHISQHERWFYPLCTTSSIEGQTNCPDGFFYFGGCVTGLAQCPSGYTLVSPSAHIRQLSYACHTTETSIAPDKLALEPVFIEEEKEACSKESDANLCRVDFLKDMKYKRVRLSPNGSMGVIVEIEGENLCGSGGCPLYVLKQTGKEYHRVWKGLGGIGEVSFEKTTTNGAYDIGDHQQAHNQSNFQKYFWDGSKYLTEKDLQAERQQQAVAKGQIVCASITPPKNALHVRQFVIGESVCSAVSKAHLQIKNLEGLEQGGRKMWAVTSSNVEKMEEELWNGATEAQNLLFSAGLPEEGTLGQVWIFTRESLPAVRANLIAKYGRPTQEEKTWDESFHEPTRHLIWLLPNNGVIDVRDGHLRGKVPPFRELRFTETVYLMRSE